MAPSMPLDTLVLSPNDEVVTVPIWPRPKTASSVLTPERGVRIPSLSVVDGPSLITPPCISSASKSSSNQIPATVGTPPSVREHLVVDAGGFIRLTQLHAFGFQTIHVTSGVAREIRDRVARHHLHLMVDVPNISTPTDMDIAFVKRFAQETGDLGFLSATDIEVVALTYMLQRMTGDVSNLKSRPARDAEMIKEGDQDSLFTWGVKREGSRVSEPLTVDDRSRTSEHAGTHSSSSDSEEDDDGADGEWISEGNLEEFCQIQSAGLDLSAVVETEDEAERRCRVACLSTDYSVQNVLVQMGLSVLSIDGMRIKTTKKWASLCRACKKVMSDTTKRFCGHCGNGALERVSISLGVDGHMIVELPTHRRNLKRKVLSIRMPGGGDRGKDRTSDLILSEDQIYIGGRDRLVRQQEKLAAKERALRDPFNPDNAYEQKGWYHRSKGEGPTKLIREVVLGRRNLNSKRR